MKRVRKNFCIHPAKWDELVEFGKERDMNASEVIRYAIYKLLAGEKQEEKIDDQ